MPVGITNFMFYYFIIIIIIITTTRYARFDVLTGVLLNIQVFGDIMLWP